jgi:endogenous inhibitor of DNA gyrase (YacG/DUF329 family)
MSKLTNISKQTNTGRTHFKKGSVPWNAGTMKMVTFTCEMCGKEVTKQDRGDGRPNRFCSQKCSTANLHKPEVVKKRALATIGTKKTPEQRAKVSGDNCHLWRGGITPTNHKIRHSYEYKLWRTAVFERDKYTCVWCGTMSQKGVKAVLNADHIKPFALYPELRFAIDNGRTLCVPCHKTTDTYLWKAKMKKI